MIEIKKPAIIKKIEMASMVILVTKNLSVVTSMFQMAPSFMKKKIMMSMKKKVMKK